MSSLGVWIEILGQGKFFVYMLTRNVSIAELAVNISLVAKFLLRAVLTGFLLEFPSSRRSGIGVGTFGLWEVESESRYSASSA